MSDLVKVEKRAEISTDRRLEQQDWFYDPAVSDPEDLSAALLRVKEFVYLLVLKHRWLILAVTLTIFGLAALQTLTTTPVYRATVQIQVDPDDPNVLPYREVSDSPFQASTEYLAKQVKAVQSRLLARRVIDRLNLRSNKIFRANTSKGMIVDTLDGLVNRGMALVRAFLPSTESPSDASGGVATEAVESQGVDPQGDLELEYLIDRWKGRLKVALIPDSRMLDIGFTSHDPVFATQAAMAAVEEFIQMNLESRLQTTSAASSFLEEQLKTLQIRVEQSDEALVEYARAHNILNYDEKQDIVLQKLADLSTRLTEAEAKLNRQKAVMEALDLIEQDQFPNELKTSTILDLERRLSGLDQKMATLRAQFDENWPEVVSTKEEMTELKFQLDREKAEALEQVRAGYQTALLEYQNLTASFNEQKGLAGSLNENLIQYRILKREVESNRDLYDGLLERLKQAGISTTLRSNNIQIVDQSGVPRVPSSPRVVIALCLGLFAGLFISFGIATALTLMDDTFKTSDEVEQIRGLACLGIVPSIRAIKEVSDEDVKRSADLPAPVLDPLAASGNLRSETWEAYRSLRTSILLSHSDRPPRTIMVTSSVPGEGKSTTSVNLAIILAQTGKRTILIDLDMRKPTIAGMFGISQGLGMSTFLSGNIETIADIRETAIPNLMVLTAGKTPPNPAELIGSLRMRQALEFLQNEFDFVIIDTPPVLSCTDAVVLAPRVDGAVMVIRSGKTPKKLTQTATGHLLRVGGTILGAVLNDVDLRRPEYAYSYNHYYHHYNYVDREVS